MVCWLWRYVQSGAALSARGKGNDTETVDQGAAQAAAIGAHASESNGCQDNW